MVLVCQSSGRIPLTSIPCHGLSTSALRPPVQAGKFHPLSNKSRDLILPTQARAPTTDDHIWVASKNVVSSYRIHTQPRRRYRTSEVSILCGDSSEAAKHQMR